MEKDESNTEPLGEVQSELEQQQASCEVLFLRFSTSQIKMNTHTMQSLA
jgi:hypothetical protein